MDEMKKGLCSLRLEKMSKVYNKKGVEDVTLVRATFSILDFNASGNKQIIPKKVGLECMETLKYKPLVCKYIETTDYENPNDRFIEHEEQEILLRNGDEYISSGTTPIGVCEDVYLGIIENDNGEEQEVIMGDFLLWLYRFPNEISLINEFYENGETLYTSCEHYYKSSKKDDDGNEIIDSFILDGHCLLGEDEYGGKIDPAYSTSKLVAFNESWNKAVNNKKNKLKSNNKKEEIEKMEKKNQMFEYLKSNNAISAGSLRYKILEQLEKVMVAEEYNNMWLSDYDIYPTENYFIYDTWTEENNWKLYKVSFSVDESDVVTVNYEDKVEVKHKIELVEVQKSLNSKVKEIEDLNGNIKELEKSLNSKNEEVSEVLKDKEVLNKKLNESNELVISLNSKMDNLNKTIETMKPIVEEYEKVEFEKALNSVKEEFREKFEKVGAIDIFEQESTQELIKKSVNAKTDEFKYQLNQLIIDNIKTEIRSEEDDLFKSTNSVIKSKSNNELTKDFTNIYEDISGIDID